MAKTYDYTFEQIDEFKAEQIKTGSRSVKYVDEDDCIYRGREIRRHDEVPTGYGGRYSTRYTRKDERGIPRILRNSTATLKEMKQFIDQLIDGVK